MIKYFLGRDNSCHWYLVQSEFRDEWEKWIELSEDDPKSWDVPSFAKGIDNPSEIDFFLEENP